MRKVLIPALIAGMALCVYFYNGKKTDAPNSLKKESSSTEVISSNTEEARVSGKKTPKVIIKSLTPLTTVDDQLDEDPVGELSESAQRYSDNHDTATEKGYGKTPFITESNPQVESVREAVQSGLYPERISVLVAPEAFNNALFKTDPIYRKKYLQTMILLSIIMFRFFLINK